MRNICYDLNAISLLAFSFRKFPNSVISPNFKNTALAVKPRFHVFVFYYISSYKFLRSAGEKESNCIICEDLSPMARLFFCTDNTNWNFQDANIESFQV